MKRLATLTVLVILAVPLTSVRADDKDKVGDSPYYPTKIGGTLLAANSGLLSAARTRIVKFW